MDGAIIADRNVYKKEAGKILKYEYITIEIKCMWNVKAKVIPVITGRLEPSQNHSHNIEQRTGKARNRGITEPSHIGHCTNTADVKAQNILHGRNKITCNINCKYRLAATLCTV